jgi:4-amino-4-deoxy-L-arabinose transferase-like glycosyltransferase
MPRSPTRERLALALLALGVAAQYAWNAWSLPAVVGYDAFGHAGYALVIAREARIPHPLSGWSTFHPPAWYLAAAAAWRMLEPFGPAALRVGLRAIGAAAWIAAGLALYGALRRSGARPETAWAATALLWLVPVCQISAVMIGNETFAAACAAAALPCLLRLQADPRDLRAAAGAGLAAGLALASKFTGAWVAVACAVPFARRDLGARGLRSLALCAAIALAVAAPAYVRNAALTGSLLPMTRTREPMRSTEAALVIRPRAVSDYVWLPLDCLRRPSVHQVAGRPGSPGNRNPAMASVPCLVLAGLWFDPFAQRVPAARHRDGEWLGPALVTLGLAPTALVLAGCLLAVLDLARTRGRSRDAPFVAMTAAAAASFAVFTWRAPSLVAAKASYLLPLAGPSAFFFARAVEALGPRLRRAALAASLAAALVAAASFTSGACFGPDPVRERMEAIVWMRLGAALPGSRIPEAVRLLGGLAPVRPPPGPAPPRAGG